MVAKATKAARITALFMAIGGMMFLAANLAGAQGIFGPKLVPYTGQLEKDGRASGGPNNLRFAFYEQSEGDERSIWTQKHDAVPVSNGRFSVNLGPIPDHVWVRETLFLEVAICKGAVCPDVAAGELPPPEETNRKYKKSKMAAVAAFVDF